MKVKQLGNGGGFDFDKTNSSFLVALTNNMSGEDGELDYLLFDCGFNVMARLKSEIDPINISKINTVFISHMDEDHVGNLKMFIYWRYFMLKQSTTILVHYSLKETMYNYLKELNSEMVGCQSVPADMYSIETVGNSIHKQGSFKMKTTNTNHGKVNCHGLIIVNENSNHRNLFISADTKASKIIEDEVDDYSPCLKFHDYSNWDCVTRNVHTCKTDFEIEYSEEWKRDTIKYHTGSLDFNKDWQDV